MRLRRKRRAAPAAIPALALRPLDLRDMAKALESLDKIYEATSIEIEGGQMSQDWAGRLRLPILRNDSGQYVVEWKG